MMPFAWGVAFALPPLAVLAQIPLFAGIGMIEGTSIALTTTVVALMLSGTLNAGMGAGFIAAWSETLETLLAAPSLWGLLRHRDKAERAPDPEHANGLLVILFAMSLAGTTLGIAAWSIKPELQAILAPMLVLTIFGACLFACLLGAIAEPRQRRLAPRVAQRVQAELLLGGKRYAGRLSDISVHGARFMAEDEVAQQVRALTGMLTLTGAAGATTLPVQLSRQTEADGRSAFGLAFTGRTVGEFATVVRLAHKTGDDYADLCDARAKPAGLTRLFAASGLRGVVAFFKKIAPPTRAEARWIPLHRRTRAH
jgi:PilZ domain